MSQQKYRVVTYYEEARAWAQTEYSTREELEKWVAFAGMKITGENFSPRQRAELQGQPIISGLLGPMWDGDAIRYENQEAYNRLSA